MVLVLSKRQIKTDVFLKIPAGCENIKMQNVAF